MNNGYTGYFGLTDTPFSIAPNPHYLFMSERHKEALAHLTYGLGEAGGFVLLTGEVGTGKTTVSKCLLEQLPENTQAAFILNPTLSAKELLATICDELAISYDADKTTLKSLTDLILEHLLANHQQGKNTLLIIDEAQHLQAQVLEQLRLLTNLETHTKKLLQVILIGQPELQTLLKRQDLRQLAQRITARYHLLPLNKLEVHDYIRHRLNVAGCQKMLFTRSAITLIHKLSDGVPRLINLLCDRALLGAYSQEYAQVNKRIVMQACEEALGVDAKSSILWYQTWFQRTVTALACALFAFSGFSLATSEFDKIVQDTQQKQQQLVAANKLASEEAKQKQLNSLNNELINNSRDLATAFKGLYSLWQVQLFSGADTPCAVADDYQLECYWFKGTPQQFLALATPAILNFKDENGNDYYPLFLQQNKQSVVLQLAGVQKEVSLRWFNQQWQSSAAILWRPPIDFVDKIDGDSNAELVHWLESNLSQLQKRSSRGSVSFDPLMVNQLQQFQQVSGLALQDHADILTVMAILHRTKPGFIRESFNSEHNNSTSVNSAGGKG